MAELSVVFDMQEANLKGDIRLQLITLQGLLEYLEDHGSLGPREYLYCQAKLHQVLRDLKRLERVIGPHRPHD